MARKYILKSFIYLTLAATAALPLAASEHHGAVKFAGLPVPAPRSPPRMGDKKLVAISDANGVYTFPDLPEGVWNMQVEMLCFTTLKMEVASAANAPSPEWELKLMPFDEIKGSAPPPATLPTAPAATTGTPRNCRSRVADPIDRRRERAAPRACQNQWQGAQTGFQGSAGCRRASYGECPSGISARRFERFQRGARQCRE